MRIGINIVAEHPQRTGIGVYTFNLLQNLAQMDLDNQYFVFAHESRAAMAPTQGSRIVFVPCRFDLRKPFVRRIWEQWMLPRRAEAWQINLLHSAHNACPLSGRFVNVLTVYDLIFLGAAGTEVPPAKAAYYRLLFPLSVKRARRIIAVSENTKRDLVKYLAVPPAKIAVIPGAVNGTFQRSPAEQQAQIRARYGLPPSFILFLGALDPYKNHAGLLKAYRSLPAALRQRHHLAMVGREGSAGPPVRRLVEQLGLGETVHFLGYAPQEHLPALYSAAALFVFPSLYEGFGLPPLEAMACGTPVVCSNASSLPEVVGDAALLVDPRDTAGLAHAIAAVLNDEARARELAARGLARAKLFSWRRTAEETLKVYREACAEGRQAGALDMRISR